VIRQHDFNTQWWGEPAGIVDHGDFFRLPAIERSRLLAPFRWVEFKWRLKDAPPLTSLQDAGFFLADTQVDFRIGLNTSAAGACSDPLEVRFAADAPFDLHAEDMAVFEHERYRHLPGNNPARTTRRYFEWASLLIRDHPECCLEVASGDAVQGWFLSRPATGSLNLALAMLHRNANISGFLLYEQALLAYARSGHRAGWASFSVTNTAVLNIYARLGARFIGPTGNWLWVAR
jgi:hypothetical protein